MSENRFDVHQALRVFAIVMKYGEKMNKDYTLDGLTVSSADDGYTVTLTNGFVVLSIFFHNSYDIQFKTEHELEQFQRALDEIDAKDKKGLYIPVAL